MLQGRLSVLNDLNRFNKKKPPAVVRRGCVKSHFDLRLAEVRG